MSVARTVIVSVLLTGAGIALAAWAPVTEAGYTGVSIGLLGGALVGAALALLMSSWARGGSATHAHRRRAPPRDVRLAACGTPASRRLLLGVLRWSR